MHVDKAELSAHYQDRILWRLICAGPAGLGRTRLVEECGGHQSGGYRKVAKEVDQLHSEGVIDYIDRRYRLNANVVDRIAFTQPALVEHFYGPEFREAVSWAWVTGWPPPEPKREVEVETKPESVSF